MRRPAPTSRPPKSDAPPRFPIRRTGMEAPRRVPNGCIKVCFRDTVYYEVLQVEVVVGPLQEAHQTIFVDALQEEPADRADYTVYRMGEVRLCLTVVSYTVLCVMQNSLFNEAGGRLLGHDHHVSLKTSISSKVFANVVHVDPC